MTKDQVRNTTPDDTRWLWNYVPYINKIPCSRANANIAVSMFIFCDIHGIKYETLNPDLFDGQIWQFIAYYILDIDLQNTQQLMDKLDRRSVELRAKRTNRTMHTWNQPQPPVQLDMSG